VAVIGPGGGASAAELEAADEVGRLLAEAGAVVAFGVGAAATVDAAALGWALAQVGALAGCAVLVAHVTRRLGGVTGDVFGAVVEIGTALTLTGLAFA
jgi:adenosylcobinamide-GDP ribazoletransferase